MKALRRYRLDLSVRCPDDDRATSILASLGPDNDGYVQANHSEGVLTFSMEADNAGRLRQTADDLLACLKVADEVSGLL